MSQVLNRLVKPLACRSFLTHNNVKVFRWCSSMPTAPYMLLDYMLKLADSGKDFSNGHIAIAGKSSYKEEKKIVIKDPRLTVEVRNAMTVGYYNGALKIRVCRNTSPTDGIRLYILYIPAYLSKTVSVPLPLLPTGSAIQNIAMNSCPDKYNEDWVVAIKLFGSKIKLCRPACPRDCRFIDVKAMPQSISTLSSLMYSKKDQRFYVPSPGSEFLYSLDPNSKENDHPEFVGLWTEDLTKHLDRLELDEFSFFTRTVHFVEAPSGEQFLVKWFFMDELEIYKGLKQVTSRTWRFIVFRSEDNPLGKRGKKLFYTDNIGDLCIFLGHGEPFCVSASSHPGLKPNCIYFVGHNFGVYDITAKCSNVFYNEEDPLRSTEFPYWSHP